MALQRHRMKRAAWCRSNRESIRGRHGILRHPSVDLESEHHTFLSRRFIARADEHRGLRASIHGDVQHVCRNEDVISRTHDVSILELIASPQIHFIAAKHVHSGFVMIVYVREGSFPVRQGNHSEPNRFRADGFRAYPGLVIAALLGAIARAALDHERFFRGSKSIVASPGRLKDSHGNLLFSMWIEALRFAGRTPKSPELSAELFRNFTKSTILRACPTTLPSVHLSSMCSVEGSVGRASRSP